MSKVRIQVERCKGCGLCVGACPAGHLEMGKQLNQSGYPCVQPVAGKKCTACGLCYRMCPDVVIEVEGK